MIKEFKEGKWYIYTGKRQSIWSSGGEMDFMLDGKPHKCVSANGDWADFEGNERDFLLWNWGDLTNFFETTEQIWTKPPETIRIQLRGGPSIAHLKYSRGDNFKRGDNVEVSNGNDKYNRIFVAYIEGIDFPYVCVSPNSEKYFYNGDQFSIERWRYAQHIPEKRYEPYTLKNARQILGDVVYNKVGEGFHITKKIEDIHVGLEFGLRVVETDQNEYKYIVSAKTLFDNFTFKDGTPCGVEVTK